LGSGFAFSVVFSVGFRVGFRVGVKVGVRIRVTLPSIPSAARPAAEALGPISLSLSLN
jgi:hypothetical protein